MGRCRGDIETNFEVRSFDADMSIEEYGRLPKHPLYIVLDNLRSAFNVGAIFRLCDTMRVSGLYLCGYTAYPPHHKLRKTSLGTVDFVPWRHFDSAVEAVTVLHDKGVQVWAAETTSHSTPYTDIRCPRRIGIVFGNEALGVSPEVLRLCDDFVEIPTYGFKNSLNVATSVAVIGYRLLEAIKREDNADTA
ncbi:MAG: TrmH family RNA methyltransferase [Chitinivibrionales bacterium]|nr:TrmH family RNA methyltransferase [Chitinivibrionales bacterium]MBD3355768.1 TrmH family RNA methyltransferase [Chitinivibrionales bacterium]